MARYAKLKSLIKAPPKGKKVTIADVRNAAKGLAGLLRRQAPGRFQIGMLDGSRETTYCFEHGGGQCKVTKGPPTKSDFQIRANKDTLAQMAAGNLSPVDAYLTGKMQVRGDLAYGKRIFARAAAGSGKRDI